jgi:hypothetical protein
VKHTNPSTNEDRSQLAELQKAPIDVNAALSEASGNALGGILGAAIGETTAQTSARIEEAKKTATDLTGLVRKRAKAESTPAANTNGNGKRKADDEPPSAESKKARVEDVVEA